MAIGQPKKREIIAPIHFVVYFFTGIATVLLGPAIPLLTHQWFISNAQAGSLFALQFAGAVAGAMLSTCRPKSGYPLGCCCCGAALAMIGWAPWMLAQCLFFLVGLGLGMIINTGNLSVTRSGAGSGRSSAGVLAKVHLAWGIGAVSCPWFIRTTIHFSRLGIFFAMIGMTFLVIALILWMRCDEMDVRPDHSSGQDTALAFRLQFAFAASFLLYTGIENSISGWLPSYALLLHGDRVLKLHGGFWLNGSLGSFAFTVLWSAHLLGRALTPLAVSLVREYRLYAWTVVALSVSSFLLTFAPGLFLDDGVSLCITAGLCGLSLSAIYPLMMGNLLFCAGNLRGIGWILCCGPLGGALLPWISGGASTWLGSIRAAFYIPCVAAVLLLLLTPALYPRQLSKP